MLKITNKQLLDSARALQALGETKDLPTKGLYRIKRAITVCRPMLQVFQDTANELLTKYSKKDEEGKPVTDKATGNNILEDGNGYVEAMKDIMDEEVELDVSQIKASTLPDKGLPSAAFMADLDWLIEDDFGELA